MRTSLVIVVGLPALAALVLTGCSSGRLPGLGQSQAAVGATGARVSAQLQSGLLKAGDLGASGWTVAPADDSSDDGGDSCDSSDPFPTANEAQVELDRNDHQEFIAEQLGSAPDEATATAKFADVIATFRKCSGVVDSDGSSVRVIDATIPKLGDQSQGFTIVVNEPTDSSSSADSGAPVLLTAAVVRDGRLLELYVYGGGVEFEAFESAVAAGVNRSHALR